MLDDELYMRLCIDLAKKAAGRTSPNPLVGSVVIDDNGDIIGEGFHQKAGTPHAEVHALNAAGESARGKTLYVSLEPCCHHGKTPPCTDKIIASGVKRVVFGLRDPNPKVAGEGERQLRDAGIQLRSGVLETECRYLNRAFLKWIGSKKPWVCLKMAATMDGRIADRNNRSQWITGPAARQFVHQLRNEYDCVLIGSDTAKMDNPSLTTRDIENGRDPFRAIVDSQLSIAPDLKVCTNADGRTFLFCSESSATNRGDQYPTTVSLIKIKTANNKLDLGAVLTALGERQILSVMCEGGAGLAGALLEADVVDEFHWLIAPKFLQDGQAIPVVRGTRAASLADTRQAHLLSVERLGDDAHIHGLIHLP